MSLPDPVLPIRVDPFVKQMAEALAFREKVTVGTYARQKLELALLQGVLKHQWRQLGFEGVLRLLSPDLRVEHPHHAGQCAHDEPVLASATKVCNVASHSSEAVGAVRSRR